jgi:competence protein ComFC
MLHGLIENILSIILPKQELTRQIESLRLEAIAANIEKAEPLSDDHYQAMFKYKNPLMRQAIWEIKYRRNRVIAQKFARLLSEYVLEELQDEAIFSNFTNPLLVPTPAGRQSMKERGFNQCELLIAEMKAIDASGIFDYSFDAVRKVKETEHQSKMMSREARLKNLSDAFWASPGKVARRNVIIIDDVITTGTTIREISKALKIAGAKRVIGFALAH